MNHLKLPAAPAELRGAVKTWSEPVLIDTYEPQTPDRNPMFLEKRVYQGSSGRVYPLPHYDRISTVKAPRWWKAVHLENEYLRAMILPEIGGRIHVLLDKTNGYDLIYRQDVIKPALVGLAGPWISGGIEFNWPQHHRPATFMPTDVSTEEHADGSCTVWCSDHDPLQRMKGMHGVCLHPGRSTLEVKVRLYNRTPLTQTFLWWANVATRVHERYQSFFPPDVSSVADHAKRATSGYPRCEGRYYGVDYGSRAADGLSANEKPTQFVPPAGEYALNDLSWYANIPVPTSYMCVGSKGDFFGGYDHALKAGIVHVADHHVSPGKKQWTWGNNEFGYRWDRLLTDPDDEGVCHPYIELMAGVFTDNQPDFSFLAPGETKVFSQFLYPIRDIGPAQQANVVAAISLRIRGREATIGVSVTGRFQGGVVRLKVKDAVVFEQHVLLAPDLPFTDVVTLPPGVLEQDVRLSVSETSAAGVEREVVAYQPLTPRVADHPDVATEPPPAEQVESLDELYLIGVHLNQYRHATRMPEEYWREALRRDAGDSRCNTAMGGWHLRRGEWREAETNLRRALARLTSRNPNPADGEAYYLLGEVLSHLDRFDDAYDAFQKSAWSAAWKSAAYHAVAEIDMRRRNYEAGLTHIDQSIRVNVDNLRARNLKSIILRRLGREEEANALIAKTRALDPLDWWSIDLAGAEVTCDTETRIDLALDYARAGLFAESIRVLSLAAPERESLSGTRPLVDYYLGYFHQRAGDPAKASQYFLEGKRANPDFCFPSRLDDIAVLQAAIANDSSDARAPYYLGNLLYDRRRHKEAIGLWERAVDLDPDFATPWRNLGIAYFNILGSAARATAAFDRAFLLSPTDGRVLYERDQLAKRTGKSFVDRLSELDRHLAIVDARDDLTLERCSLCNLAGRHEEAHRILSTRQFQPWEGGEGIALGQWASANVAMGRRALHTGDLEDAIRHFKAALTAPVNLGESWHPLMNMSHVYYWLGEAHAANGEESAAQTRFAKAARFVGDFQGMSVRAFSEMTYFSAIAQRRLGDEAGATQLLQDLLAYAEELEKAPAVIDYFATSLPTLLLFEDDLQHRQTIAAKFMHAQALLGLGQTARGRHLLDEVLASDPTHFMAKYFTDDAASHPRKEKIR